MRLVGLRRDESCVYQLAAYVVMDDHVHARLTPIAGYELKAILHSLEVVHRPSGAAASKRFGRVRQDESFDRIVRDDEEFAQSLITFGNPWKRWPEIGDYPWVWPLDR